jgi:hypothetical protein
MGAETCEPGDLPVQDNVVGRGVPERVHGGGFLPVSVLASLDASLMEDGLE